MSRPTNKTELLELSTQLYERLLDKIELLTPEEQQREFPAGTMNRNIRDVLTHLHHWHLMLLDWYQVGMNGGKPDMPAKGYTWKTTPQLNQWIWEQYQNTSIEEAKAKLIDSHAAVMKLIVKHSNEELFEKKRYPWTGSTSLGAYLVSATTSHYDWAVKMVRRGGGGM